MLPKMLSWQIPPLILVLLGADVAAVLTGEVIFLGPGLLTAVGSKFDFVVTGTVPAVLNCSLACVDLLSVYPVLYNQLHHNLY